MQQGHRPPQSNDNQPRSRRTQRYEQQKEQGQHPEPASRPQSDTGFPERERLIYQPTNNRQPAYQEPHNKANDIKPRNRRLFIVWTAVAVLIIIIGVIGRESIYTIEATSDNPITASISTPPTIQATTAAVATPSSTPAVTKQIYSTLSQGSTGDNVNQLQQQLILLGYLNDVADGIYGSKTYAAIMSYQSQNNITITGIADSNTLSSLYSSSAKRADSSTVASEPIKVSSASSNATTSQKNAVSLAKAYLSFTAFSYMGLIEQLEYEEFSHADAVYGADNCAADWNEQALNSAITYLDYSAFSYSGLIEQLEYEEFTVKQAQYGADNCGADWNEQAVKSAKSYLSFSAFSRNDLIEQLEYEGFTHSQAVYGVTANGY